MKTETKIEMWHFFPFHVVTKQYFIWTHNFVYSINTTAVVTQKIVFEEIKAP